MPRDQRHPPESYVYQNHGKEFTFCFNAKHLSAMQKCTCGSGTGSTFEPSYSQRQISTNGATAIALPRIASGNESHCGSTRIDLPSEPTLTVSPRSRNLSANCCVNAAPPTRSVTK